MFALDLLVFCLLANCCASLPVIFGYHSPHTKSDHHQLVDCNPTPKHQQNDLFVASVNQAIQRPMTLKDNAISYNENIDRSNYIPTEFEFKDKPSAASLSHKHLIASPSTDQMSPELVASDQQELDSQQEELPADHDFHASYRRLVTRTVKDSPQYQYSLEDTPVFEYHTATTTDAPSTTTETGRKLEECFENSDQLPRSTIKKMNKRRRKLAQSIRRLNKLQRTYCLTATRMPKQKVQTRCSAWRNEKMALYVKLLRLEHCTKSRAHN